MALSLDEALGMSLADEADESIHVDVNTRQITIPESQRLFGVESDTDVEVKHIVIDGRYADGNRDLSKLAWRVIYRNANKDTSYYLIPSVVANENSIEMDWLIKRSVVAYKGTVDFILCAFATTSSGEVTPEWNSTLGQGVVLEGLETSAIDINKEAVDELAKILYETIKTANSINESMTQIAANKEAIGQLKDSKISKFYASSQGDTNLPDSDTGRIVDLKLYGKSEQKQYSGKNLLDWDLSTNQSIDDSGFVLDDTTRILSDFIRVTSDNYTASGHAGYELVAIAIYDENQKFTERFIVQDKSGSYTKQFTDGFVRLYYSKYDGTQDISKEELSRVMFEKGSTATAYEPYVGGIPSPNPEYPQEIKSVVKPRVKVRGKNLLDLRSGLGGTGDGVTYTQNGDGSYTRKGTATGNSGNVWFLGGYGDLSVMSVLFTLKAGTYTAKDCVIFSGTGDHYDTFTIENDLPVTGVRNLWQDVGASYNDVVYPRILAGSTDTGWESYTEQTATLPYTLNAIPVTSGGNVTIDGQQYVADYVDVERGKLVRMCKTVDFEEFATTTSINDMVNSKEARFISNVMGIKAMPSTTPNHEAGFITSIRRLTQGLDTWDMDLIGVWQCGQGEDRNLISIRIPVATTAAEYFKSIGGCKGVFQAAAPTETDLTIDEIAAFKSLVSYYPVTNVSTTSDQLDGYTVFNYPISLANGWNYVKQQLGDTRDYLYGIDLMTAEAYVNSEYAAALAEIEV